MKKSLFGLLLVPFILGGTHLKAQTSPSAISNLQLWLDASDPQNNGTSPTGALSTWKDKSGQNHDATVLAGQATGNIVASQINGKSVVRFVRTSQTAGTVYNSGVDIRATTMPAVTIFTVYKQGAQGGEQGLWGNDNGAWDRFYFTTTTATPNNGAVSLGPQTTPTAVITNAGLVGTTRLMTAVYDRNNANGSAVYFDGGLVQSFTDQTDFTAAQTSLRIGWDGDDNAFNGDIAEMLVYNRKLTLCEIQQVNRYLGAKYGITFSSTTITPVGATTFYEGASVVLNANSGTAYKWLRNGTVISGATSQSYTAYLSGNYQAIVTNGCDDTSGITTVTANPMTAPGNALNLDGVDDYVDLGNGSAANPTALAATNIKTMECWVKFNRFNGNDQEILSKSTTGSGVELLVYGTQLAFFCMDGTSNCHIDYSTSNLQTGIWYHLAATWDGVNKNSMRLYVNGTSVGTYYPTGTNVSPVTDPAGSTFKIGRWSTSPTTRNFSGSIDEVRLWSQVRTETELQSTMYAPLTLPTTGLLAYYKMDQNAAANYAYDYSGNGITGSLQGFTLSGATSNWVESYAMVKPVISNASSVRQTSFRANWQAPATGPVDSYWLEVANDAAFTSLLSGYRKNVGNVTNYLVTGLTLGNTYYYRVGTVRASADGTAAPTAMGIVTTQIPLPVNLLSFTASANKQAAILDWTTASEQNSDHYEVERSVDAVSFKRIALVAAAGNTIQQKQYQVMDEAPENGTNYYRLKMVDMDGSFSYSAIRQVAFKMGAQTYTIYPTPATDYLVIEAAKTGATGAIMDIYGRPVLRFTLDNLVTKLAVNTLPAGNYLVRLSDGSVFKISKQ